MIILKKLKENTLLFYLLVLLFFSFFIQVLVHFIERQLFIYQGYLDGVCLYSPAIFKMVENIGINEIRDFFALLSVLVASLLIVKFYKKYNFNNFIIKNKKIRRIVLVLFLFILLILVGISGTPFHVISNLITNQTGSFFIFFVIYNLLTLLLLIITSLLIDKFYENNKIRRAVLPLLLLILLIFIKELFFIILIALFAEIFLLFLYNKINFTNFTLSYLIYSLSVLSISLTSGEISTTDGFIFPSSFTQSAIFLAGVFLLCLFLKIIFKGTRRLFLAIKNKARS